ncbi:hypothetical protein Phum_PHUM566260 [Pediculus humanus corporis]|uniref:Uncharacterized protein n=1 Tax=Pediculus humanus subsp. corporis TaxID=121224 RepID=E0W106_PEDHC|nr:uncharacterized protein Phum_PHUM566260 [Pediculus humanus corporis]EEB19311.1 hypothetical protein Phum_PHUM566260 [Pediculus humanus corporis]
MPVKFDWDIDPGDLQSCFHLDHALNTSSGDTEAEFYSNRGVSPNLPNDDIWKKFDMTDEFGFDEELDDLLEDVASVTWMSPMYDQKMTKDAREIRNHDCMWAGHCISEKHDKNNQKISKCINLLPLKKPAAKAEEPKVVAVTATPESKMIPESNNKVFIRKNAVVAPTHARSILLPTRVVNAPVKGSQNKQNAATSGRPYGGGKPGGGLTESGESPRPETPQSLSDNEDLNLDLPDIKTVEDFAVDTFGYNFVCDIINNVGSDVSNSNDDSEVFDLYLDGINGGDTSSVKSFTESSSKVSPGTKVNRTNIKQEVPMTRHYTTHSFFSDHCYHLSKNARMDNLGVQTPSDSGVSLILLLECI